MRRPQPVGTPLNMPRMRTWLEDFAGYRVTVNEGRIHRWLVQFADTDRDLAARLLDVVDFIGNEQIAAALRSSLQSLADWHPEEARRTGRWFFVPFSGSAGESGDHMVHRFRTANHLAGRRHDALFKYRSDLLSLAPGAGDTVVLIDDFAGTGGQACDAWREIYEELLPYGPTTYLLLVASSSRAMERIRQETRMVPHAHFQLGQADDFFEDACQHFTTAEKENVLRYCEIADPHAPRGFGDCGFVVVLAHKCPNNSLPVLHVRRGEWEGLFRRYD